MNILVTGSNGLLGKSLIATLKQTKHNIFETSRGNSPININLENYNEIDSSLKNINLDIIFNLAAYTNVDNAEKNFSDCFKSNITTITNIVNYISNSKKKIKLIHLSTDQFYNNINNCEKNIEIINTYALSKFISELIVRQIKNSIIFRTNFFGKSLSQNRQSFSDWIFSNLKLGNSIELFDDIYFSPLHISTLNEYLIQSIDKNINGIFNLGSTNGFSKYEFGMKFANILQIPTNNIKRKSIVDKKLIAKRPNDMRMNIQKFEKHFNTVMPTLEKEIFKLKNQYHV